MVHLEKIILRASKTALSNQQTWSYMIFYNHQRLLDMFAMGLGTFESPQFLIFSPVRFSLFIQAYPKLVIGLTPREMIWNEKNIHNGLSICLKIFFAFVITYLFTEVPWPGNNDRTFRSSSQSAIFSFAYHTRWRFHTLFFFFCWTLSRKAAVNNNFYRFCFDLESNQAEAESRTPGSRPRPRTQRNPRPRSRTDFPRTDLLEAKNRNARGQGPKTQRASVLQKKGLCAKISQIFREISGVLHKKKGLRAKISQIYREIHTFSIRKKERSS